MGLKDLKNKITDKAKSTADGQSKISHVSPENEDAKQGSSSNQQSKAAASNANNASRGNISINKPITNFTVSKPQNVATQQNTQTKNDTVDDIVDDLDDLNELDLNDTPAPAETPNSPMPGTGSFGEMLCTKTRGFRRGDSVDTEARLKENASGGTPTKREERKAITTGKNGKYSATREAQFAYTELKSSLADLKAKGASTSFADKALTALRFVGHLIHILFRTIWRMLIGVAVLAAVCLVVGILGVGVLYFSSADELPNVEDYTQISMPQDSTIYDADGEVIGVVSTVHRESVGFGEISQEMKDAIVAIEDERFYTHSGVDFQGIARALYSNFVSWRTGEDDVQGASTITQQYVRNAYDSVGTEQTIKRKLVEMMLAAQLEATISKDDILNSYLNTIYFGNGCYGVEAASQHYFGHSASTLDYYESAVLSAIINGPAVYDPEEEDGIVATAERANLVLDKMYSLGYLGDMSQEELRELKSTDLASRLNITETETVINQPYYYDYVLSELYEDYTKEEIESGGWQIYTTLSIADGEAAQDVIEAVESRYSGQGITGAIVDIDNETGAINAFCGGTDYNYSQYNIATQAHLQTGSTLKPIVYATLCEYDGWYFSDEISAEAIDIGTADSPHVITPYVSTSKATLKQGIIASDNAVTIHVAQEAGMSEVQEMCAAVGIETAIDDNVVATIGGQTTGLTPLELASAYSTIERGGDQIDYWCIKQITDTLGNEIYTHQEERDYAMSEEVTLQVIDAMKAAVDEAGWYNIAFDKQGWTIAAKTGTTNDTYDSWCVGFDHDRSVAIWVGGRDSQVTVPNASYNTTGSFSDYFELVGQNDSKDDWASPQYKTEIPEMEEDETLEEYMSRVQERQLSVEIEYVSATNTDDGDVIGVTNAGELVDRGGSAVVQVVRDVVAVPDFTGLTPAEAYDQAEGLDLKYNVVYSSSGSSNPTISAQSVSAGEVVAKGTTVEVDITILSNSDNSGTIQQVSVLGTSSALSMLQSENSQLKTLNEQLEAALQEAQSSSTTTTDDSSSTVTIPNLIGLTAEDAKQVLTSLGLNVSYSGSDSATITGCSPSSGSSVNEGSTVTLRSSSSNTNSNSNTNSSSRNSNSNSNSNRNTTNTNSSNR